MSTTSHKLHYWRSRYTHGLHFYLTSQHLLWQLSAYYSFGHYYFSHIDTIKISSRNDWFLGLPKLVSIEFISFQSVNYKNHRCDYATTKLRLDLLYMNTLNAHSRLKFFDNIWKVL